MLRLLARYVRSTGGNAAIEFAIAVPVMILLAGGAVEFGLIFKVYNQTNRLASQYAISWSDCSDVPTGACAVELLQYTTNAAIGNIAPQLVPANVTLTMYEVTMNGATPTVIYAYPALASPSATERAAAQAAFASGQTGVIVTVTYQHSLMFFSGVVTTFLSGQLRPSFTITQLKS